MSNDEMEHNNSIVMRTRNISETRRQRIEDIQNLVEIDVIGSTTENNFDTGIYLCMSNNNTVTRNIEMNSETIYVEMHYSQKEIEYISSKSNKLFQNCQSHKYSISEYNSNIKPLKGDRDYLHEDPILNKTTLHPDLFYCAKLREDAAHCGGVELDIPSDYLLNIGISFVNWNIYISRCPREPNMSGKVYIGDRIISLNNKILHSTLDFNNFMMKIKQPSIVKVLVQRLPYAKLFLVNTENPESIIKFNESKEIWVLKEPGASRNRTQFDFWFMTEVDGFVTENIFEQKSLKKSFTRGQNRYIPVIMHSQWFVNKIVNK